MAALSLTDAFLYVGGTDFTTVSNSATLTTDAAQLDATTFNSNGWTEVVGGLKTTNLAWSGYWDNTADQDSFTGLSTTQPYTFGPVETEGQPAYMVNAQKTQYTLLGAVGEVVPFSLTANAASPDGTVRGRLACAKQTVAGTGVLGSGQNIGALNSSQYLYATFHLFTSGQGVSDALTVILESDDNSGFTTPTSLGTVASYASGAASTGTWLTKIAGPITDTWFRFKVTSLVGSTWVVGGAIGKA